MSLPERSTQSRNGRRSSHRCMKKLRAAEHRRPGPRVVQVVEYRTQVVHGVMGHGPPPTYQPCFFWYGCSACSAFLLTGVKLCTGMAGARRRQAPPRGRHGDTSSCPSQPRWFCGQRLVHGEIHVGISVTRSGQEYASEVHARSWLHLVILVDNEAEAAETVSMSMVDC